MITARTLPVITIGVITLSPTTASVTMAMIVQSSRSLGVDLDDGLTGGLLVDDG